MKYRTTLMQFGPNNTGVPVPEEVLASFGRGRRVKVRATVNGYTYRTSAAPYDGLILMPVNAEHREATGLRGGEEIEVELVADDEPRSVEVPDDLAAALAGEPEAQAFFDGLSYTHRRSFTLWIESARKAETRTARVEKAVIQLRERQTR